MASGETVAFSLRAVDKQGHAVPLAVTRAVAQGIAFGNKRSSAQVPVVFVDDGSGADRVANDGTLVAVLDPAHTGLANFNGPISTEVRYNVNGHDGVVQFEVVYSPELPAAWTGQVREAQEDGSLVFYLKADVREPGRYVVNGRVDDARGKPFALATFNDVLGPGINEVRLTVFGKLMRDGAPALPLTLRDVDGYLRPCQQGLSTGDFFRCGVAERRKNPVPERIRQRLAHGAGRACGLRSVAALARL
jgi:hypothetical protein